MNTEPHSAFKTTLEGYRFALDLSPVPMLLVERNGLICHANPELCSLFGYTLSELLSQSVEILVPESSRDQHPDLRNAYARLPSKRKMGENRDLYGRNRTGTVIPLDLGLESVEVDGQAMSLVTAIDISQRKAIELRMQLAIDASASAMIMTDEQHNIILANAAAESLFGYETGELIGHAIDVLVPDNIKRIHPVYMSSFISNSEARSMGGDSQIVALHKDGHPIRVQIALTPVETPEGTMVMSTIIDLTQHLETTRTLQERADELEELNAELAHFAYSASHDLKAPMLTIKGLIDACQEDLQDKQTNEVLGNLQRAADICQRSGNMISNVLAISRAGKDYMQTERFSLKALIDTLWQTLAYNSTEKFELTVDLPADDQVETELVTLELILSNLLGNAMRFVDAAKPQYRLHITGKALDNTLTLSIRDNGIGIPLEYHHQVFEMFKRFDQRSGSGLGLALVRKHVSRLGGTIAMTSEPGNYCEFVLNLPLGESKQSAQETL